MKGRKTTTTPSVAAILPAICQLEPLQIQNSAIPRLEEEPGQRTAPTRAALENRPMPIGWRATPRRYRRRRRTSHPQPVQNRMPRNTSTVTAMGVRGYRLVTAAQCEPDSAKPLAGTDRPSRGDDPPTSPARSGASGQPQAVVRGRAHLGEALAVRAADLGLVGLHVHHYILVRTTSASEVADRLERSLDPLERRHRLRVGSIGRAAIGADAERPGHLHVLPGADGARVADPLRTGVTAVRGRRPRPLDECGTSRRRPRDSSKEAACHEHPAPPAVRAAAASSPATRRR